MHVGSEVRVGDHVQWGVAVVVEGPTIATTTIPLVMPHDRIITTEQYVAYARQPDLAERLARARAPTPGEASCVPSPATTSRA